MNGNRNHWLIGAAAFTGGLVSGYLIASRPGERLRARMAGKIPVPGHWVETRLQEIEQQLNVLEEQLTATSTEFSERLRETTRQMVDQVVPAVPDDPEAWKVDGEEIEQDLRFMPRC